MANPVLNALRRNLEIAEKAELTDKVKRLKTRITQLEKAPAPKTPPASTPPTTVTSTVKETVTYAEPVKAATNKAAEKRNK